MSSAISALLMPIAFASANSFCVKLGNRDDVRTQRFGNVGYYPFVQKISPACAHPNQPNVMLTITVATRIESGTARNSPASRSRVSLSLNISRPLWSLIGELGNSERLFRFQKTRRSITAVPETLCGLPIQNRKLANSPGEDPNALEARRAYFLIRNAIRTGFTQ